MNKPERRITRGILAKHSGINIETIRYYEQIGLMPDPKRSDGGHRIYDEHHVRRLRFIRRARDLGFTLEEIKSLLALIDEERLTCAEVLAQTAKHLNDVRKKIAELRKMERKLNRLMGECDGDNRPECPIIEALLLA